MKKEVKEVREMMTFNKTISIEVSVDSIASKMLDCIDDANPHKVLIAETIVGTLCAEERLSSLYNALHGWESKIDFVVGQELICSTGHYNGDVRKPIGKCSVVSIDRYKSDYPIQVEFEYINGEDSARSSSKWVSMKSLSAIPAEDDAMDKPLGE